MNKILLGALAMAINYQAFAYNNNYNKDVFAHFKKHKVEPIVFNFRHRFFWDGGIHCITQDLYREGTMEDYFG